MSFIPFLFPEATALGQTGRKIPKETIYQQANPSSEVRQLFITQLEQIRWRYKLAPDTLNLGSSDDVSEIQVFEITLKPNITELDFRILETLDKTILSAIYYQVYDSKHSKMQCLMAAKRANIRDEKQMIIQDYFASEWILLGSKNGLSTDYRSLPLVVSISGLYHELLRSLLSEPARLGESLDQQLERISSLRQFSQSLIKLQSQLRREKQFNRKVEINRKINQLKQQIERNTGNG